VLAILPADAPLLDHPVEGVGEPGYGDSLNPPYRQESDR
jgi:hypothetical protein